MARKNQTQIENIELSENEELSCSEAELSENESETKPIKKTSKPTKRITIQEKIETIDIPKPEKKKRIMNERQKEVLANARKLARAKLKEKSELSAKIKEIKKEKHLIQKLELQAKIAEHEDYKRKLMIRAGLVELPKEDENGRIIQSKERKVRKDKGGSHCEPEPETDSEDDREIKEIEEKLKRMKSKNKKIEKIVKKKKEESDNESEEEDPLLRAKPKAPVITKNKATIDDSERFRPNNVRKSNDSEINKQIQLLFPNYG